MEETIMMHSPPHPGAILEETLEARGISVSQAARDLKVSRVTVSGIVNESKPISTSMAIRLGHYLGTGPEVWVNLQAQFDLWELRDLPAEEDIPIAANG